MTSIGRVASKPLLGIRVLLVEDDFLLLSELDVVLREAGAAAVYACRSVADAAAMLDSGGCEAAILDVRVGRNSVAPVVRKLTQRGIPLLFYTGQISTDQTLREWPDRLVISKPASFHRLVHALAGLTEDKSPLPRRNAS